VKIRTYTPSEEEVVSLALLDHEGGGVSIHIVDAAGRPIRNGCIARISRSGKLRLEDCVADGHGLELNSDGQIVVYDSGNNRMVPHYVR